MAAKTQGKMVSDVVSTKVTHEADEYSLSSKTSYVLSLGDTCVYEDSLTVADQLPDESYPQRRPPDDRSDARLR